MLWLSRFNYEYELNTMTQQNYLQVHNGYRPICRGSCSKTVRRLWLWPFYNCICINYQQPRNLAFALNVVMVHLLNCFEQGFITMFSVMKTRWATVQVKAYRKRFMSIVCQRYHAGSTWIECKDWMVSHRFLCELVLF